jgi:hypothetical protein
MKRSFEYSLRPKMAVPSTKPTTENLWSLDTAIKAARKGMRAIAVNQDRSAELFIDDSIGLSATCIEKIIAEIGRNKVSREPIEIYGGAGWPREYFFGGRNGMVCRYEALKENAVGYCSLQEAVSEFLMCRELKARLNSATTETPFPVGWGKFHKTDDQGSKYGFVIMGHPDLIPGRERVYLEAVDELAQTDNFDAVGHLLTLRAQSMREVNQAGVTIHGRHFGNFSLTASGKSYMHDLGNPTSLIRENMHSDEQFLAETFAELAYAVTPRKIVVPVPGPDSPYRNTIMKHLDTFTETFLKSYYQDDAIGTHVKFEDFEETFFASLHKPLTELKTATALLHCNTVRKWLEDYRHKQNAGTMDLLT